METDVLGQSLALRRTQLQYWPRRLLHIPTMCSLQKQAGNRYGLSDPVTEPPYATLCYTWARYLRNAGNSACGVQISGIKWRTPAIDPEHFTARSLLKAIDRTRKISQVDYLWIDIACINTDRIPDDDLDPEFSMQQDIFFDATASFIWLSRTGHSSLFHLGMVLADASLLADAKTVTRLMQVMADPWFSSLWTLAEAAVRTDAVILSSDCHAITVDREKFDLAVVDEPKAIRFTSQTGDSVSFAVRKSEPILHGRDKTQSAATSQCFTLRDLIRLVHCVMKSLPTGVARERFHEAVNKSGLLSFQPFNLLSLYGSAQHRHEMKAGLRMKYIHTQVFGFGGLPADSALPQVEDHFNCQLVQQYPVLSQLFIRHTQQTGSAWRLTMGCEIPDIHFFVAYASSYRSLFTLKVHKSMSIGPIDKQFTVFFRGPTCAFRTMASQWLGHDMYPSHQLLGLSFDQCTLSRRDGSKVKFETMALFPEHSPGGYTLSKTSQTNCIGHFLDSLGDLEARILAMAVGSEILPGCDVGVGLIIIPQHRDGSDKLWQRVGLCFWTFEKIKVIEKDRLPSSGLNPSEDVWKVTEGYSVD